VRVAENLNLALHAVFEADPDVHLLGEDVADPYGGAFKITKGLSARFPDRVLATPISEGGFVGVAAGLALAGVPAIAEIMFADFATLAFDQLVNFAGKSVSMYGRRLPLPLLLRCATGAGRGYGPTHSQSLQKHFIGVPGLSLYEVSPFVDNRALVPGLLARAEPAILFEDKILYTRPMFADGRVDELFSYDFPYPGADTARVFLDDPGGADCVVIAPGGVAYRALDAMRTLLLEHEISCALIVPSRLYPLEVEPLLPSLRGARGIVVVEDSTAGGTWGENIAQQIHGRLWGELERPVTLVNSAGGVIPAAAHLERRILVRDATISRTVLEVLGG
jgi:pyruvate/2-oxoglutarate/acetoin dehydrogenase E1 component